MPTAITVWFACTAVAVPLVGPETVPVAFEVFAAWLGVPVALYRSTPLAIENWPACTGDAVPVTGLTTVPDAIDVLFAWVGVAVPLYPS